MGLFGNLKAWFCPPVATSVEIPVAIPVEEPVLELVTPDGKKKRYRRNYPKTVAEVLDDNIKYRPSVLETLERFKKTRPWKGDKESTQKKIKRLNTELAECYAIEEPQVVFVREFQYGACYFPVGNLIILTEEDDGRYSVVTFLHEFGHALGKDEKQTCRWSINLFRKVFPRSFARLVPDGHLLRRQQDGEVPQDQLPVG